MAKLLIADDEPEIRTLIRKYAEFGGYDVDEASDGMEAVARCRREKYDAMILDIMMPELDGFSVCREVRKFSDIPILLLSARGEEYDKINGFECGADDYVVKPFSPRELMLRVEAVLRRRKNSEGTAEKKELYTFDGVTVEDDKTKDESDVPGTLPADMTDFWNSVLLVIAALVLIAGW